MKTALTVLALAVSISTVQACEVRLKHPVPICAAVTFAPEDCQELAKGELTGKAGDLQTSPAMVHVMSSGHSYYCASHEGCIEMKDLDFKGCKFVYVARKAGESKEYMSHILVK